MLVFVQVFGLQSAGGGSRILRSLLQDAPTPFLSISTAPKAPPSTNLGQEIHLPFRPSFGRLDRSRFGKYTGYLDPFFANGFQKRLTQCVEAVQASAIHAIPQGLDFWYALQVAQALGIPYYLTVHDELTYNLKGNPSLAKAMHYLSIAWTKAQGRMVISEEMGREYCRRYGEEPYVVVTDGLAEIAAQPQSRDAQSLRLYFMGSVHLSYEANFQALLQALNQFKQDHPSWDVSLTIRGGLPFALQSGTIPVKLLPWATETEVAQDLDDVDLLYLPLPFEAENESFVRYSLSTKLVTYLGSGLPMLYHGSREAAAGRLLSQHNAAIIADSLSPKEIQQSLTNSCAALDGLVNNALELGRKQFSLTDVQKRFWQTLQF